MIYAQIIILPNNPLFFICLNIQLFVNINSFYNYFETTVNLTPPTFSFTTLAWGFQLGWGGEKMKDPLTHGSKGPTLLPEIQDPFDPHHPIEKIFQTKKIQYYHNNKFKIKLLYHN